MGYPGGMERWPIRREMKPAPAAGPGRAVEAYWALAEAGRWELAKLVARERAVSLVEAGRRLGISRKMVSRRFQALRRVGLVNREALADDRRQWVFRLTETGEALVQAGMLME
jgi:DNA-binding HxlR family transcriptional regulator